MTGVSGFTYWATMFVFDLTILAVFVVLLTVGLISVDYAIGLNFYQIHEILMTVLLLMLFVINVLPLIYAFSFIEARTKNLVKLLTFLPMALAIFAIPLEISEVIDLFPEPNGHIENLPFINEALKVLLGIPHASLTHGYIVLHWLGLLRVRCDRLSEAFYKAQCVDVLHQDICCELKYDKYFLAARLKNKVTSLNKSVIYLCSTPTLYFAILALLESRMFQKIMVKFRKRHATEYCTDDEQVKREKLMVFQQIQQLKIKTQKPKQYARYFANTSENRAFLVYQIQKSYKNVKLVSDITFGVDRGECFGLFGVNRSGKSMTLRLIAGEKILDCGLIYMVNQNTKIYERCLGSHVGYCSQYDVTCKCLNAYDHLRLFARLRGIPEKQIKNEVQAWIDILNLNACASVPSGNLSSGNNQRLNIAIALVGNPDYVLLDEPTSRMDPGARRSLWNTIRSRLTDGQTFLLASSSIEECVAACNRMAIMSDGKLTCIGSPKELQQRFGAGYDVQVRINPSRSSIQVDQVKKDIQLLLHCLLINEHSNHLLYRIAGPGMTWKKIYETMNKIKSKYDCIDDFVVVVLLSA